MIIDEIITIKEHYKTREYYTSKGFKFTDKLLSINSSDLIESSHYFIRSKCDICGIENRIKCYSYYTNFSNMNIYTCLDCCYIKKQNTCIKNYGVDNPSKSKYIKEKKKETCLKNYGVDSPLKSRFIMNNMREYFMNKYGVDWPTKCEEFSNKKKETNILRYGTPHTLSSPIIREKIEKTNLIKYGNKCSLNNKKIREKAFNTMFSRYGVKYPYQCSKILEKVRITSINNGNRVENSGEYKIYSNRVRYLSTKNYSFLFNNWDGKDFYDDEYIKNNKEYDHNHRLYPTVDHKISIFHGFKNKISENDIARIENLCITKRHINSSKNKNIYTHEKH